MKSIDQNWYDYINELNEVDSDTWYTEIESIEIQKLHNKMDKISNKCHKYLDAIKGSVMTSKTPKFVFKEKLGQFPGRHKYKKYGFKLQCSVTGRISVFIKVDEWPTYGILPDDGDTGGGYPDRMDIPNKYRPIEDYYHKNVVKIYNRIREINTEAYNRNSGIYEEMDNVWKQRYSEYLNSPEWLNRREKLFHVYGTTCSNPQCNSDRNIQVHHLNYDNVGKEQLFDLIVVCRSCHERLHSMPYADRFEKESEWSINQVTRVGKHSNSEAD